MDGILLMLDYCFGEKMFFVLKWLCECDIILIFVIGCYVLEMYYVIGEFFFDVFLIIGNGMCIYLLEGEEFYCQDFVFEVVEVVLYGKWDIQVSMYVFNDGGWFIGQVRFELL